MRQDFFFNLKISELLLFFKIMALIPDPDIWQKKKKKSYQSLKQKGAISPNNSSQDWDTLRGLVP